MLVPAPNNHLLEYCPQRNGSVSFKAPHGAYVGMFSPIQYLCDVHIRKMCSHYFVIFINSCLISNYIPACEPELQECFQAIL